MADILFIMPRFRGTDGDPVTENFGPPLPFLWLGAVLELKGYSIKIVDAGLHVSAKNVIASELDKKPIFAGFYSHVGESVGSVIELSSFVKEYSPETPVIHGGVLPSMNPELTLKEPYVDIVVIGEGEETVLEVIDALKENKLYDNIKGIGFKKDGKIFINPDRPLLDMDTLPLPAWHLIKADIDKYLLTSGYKKDGTAIPGLHILSSKGCPANCSFCFAKQYQKRYRYKDAARTLDEIEYLVKNYNVSNFYYHDEDFIINKKRMIEFCKGIKDRNLNIRFSCQTRIDSVDEILVKEASEAGLVGLSFGIEFCKEDVLKSYKKGINIEQAFNVAEICRKYNVLSHFNFICGYPSETYGDMMTTVKVSERLRDINPFSEFLLYIYTPNYGTAEYRELEEKYNFYPKKLADCEWLHWSTFKNKKWIKNLTLCENFYRLYELYFRFSNPKFFSNKTPALYKSKLVRKWAYLRLKGPFLGFAPEISLYKLFRHLFQKLLILLKSWFFRRRSGAL
jgi:anaerobic magnesium-protoporphyrin IX monomethyl ester cyclase